MAKLTPCPICCQLVGHDRKLHKEAEQQDKDHGKGK